MPEKVRVEAAKVWLDESTYFHQPDWVWVCTPEETISRGDDSGACKPQRTGA